MDYVKLLPLINKVFVPEAIKLKLLRLCLGELGQSTFDARLLHEACSIYNTLNHLNSMCYAENNIFKMICQTQPMIYSIEPSSNLS